MNDRPDARSLPDLARAAGDLLVDVVGSTEPQSITGLAYDSRRVEPGDLFFCIPGTVTDGHKWAPDAVAAGAVALMVERRLAAGEPQIVVTDARRAMARMAAEFYGRPAAGLEALIGVTGTNGKTTTAYLLESILRAAGHVTGMIGTVETRVAGTSHPGVRTTPESVDLQHLLFDMRRAGVEAVVMEVTSHGLALNRVEGLSFSVAAFTNLSQDHLDFHTNMEDYFETKRSLFVPERTALAVSNLDDPYGRKLKENSSVLCVGFGTADDAEVRALDVRFEPHATTFLLEAEGRNVSITTGLVGSFNVSNCLAAAAAAVQAGIDLDHVRRGIEDVRAVPGRFESIVCGQPFTVIVDYAHTPDSLENALRAARMLAVENQGRVVCAFGCGGDRDKGKRPLMGTVAARLADYVIVTSDNPRSEDPETIIGEILEGVASQRREGADAVYVDRSEAIAHALERARPGDVVVIAGKGHETGQEFAGVTVDFDDRQVAREALAARGWDAS